MDKYLDLYINTIRFFFDDFLKLDEAVRVNTRQRKIFQDRYDYILSGRNSIYLEEASGVSKSAFHAIFTPFKMYAKIINTKNTLTLNDIIYYKTWIKTGKFFEFFEMLDK